MLERSARIVDGTDAAPIGLKVTVDATPVEEVAPGIGVIESFSNVVVFNTDDGLTLCDIADGLMTAFSGISVECVSATDVVGVTVGVDGSVYGVLRPCTETGDNTLGCHAVRDVEQCESVIGVEDDDITK